MGLFHNIEEGFRGGYRVNFDLKNKPNAYVTYKIGDRVERDNFVDMFIQSFAFSLGDLEAQKAYLETLRKYDGFNYVSTFENYLQWGPAALSETERTNFIGAYRHVQASNPDAHRLGSDRDILDSIGIQMAMIINKERFLINSILAPEDRARLRGKQDLLPHHGLPIRREPRRLQLR